MVKYTSTQMECIKRENIPLHVPVFFDGAKVDLVPMNVGNSCNIPTWATTQLWAPTIQSSTEPMNRAIWGMLHLLIQEGYLEVGEGWGKDISKILNTLAHGDQYPTYIQGHIGAQFHGLRGRQAHCALMGLLGAMKRASGAFVQYWDGAKGPNSIETLPFPIAQWVGQFEIMVDEDGEEEELVFHSETFMDGFLNGVAKSNCVYRTLETIAGNMIDGMDALLIQMGEASIKYTQWEMVDFGK